MMNVKHIHVDNNVGKYIYSAQAHTNVINHNPCSKGEIKGIEKYKWIGEYAVDNNNEWIVSYVVGTFPASSNDKH